MNPLRHSLDAVYSRHRGVSILFSKTIVVLLMTCLGYGYAQFIGAWFPFNASFLTYFSLLIAWEAMYTHAKITTLEGRDKILFRASEVLTLIILYKVFLLIISGPAQAFQELTTWQVDFMASFMNGPFIAGLLLFIPVWLVTTALAGTIDELHDREQDSSWDELGKIQNALHYIRGRIAQYVFGIGALVLVFAVGARLNLREYIPVLQNKYNPSIPIANVLIYFVLVLALLSQSQFALLRTRWLWNKTPVTPLLGRKWMLYALGFFSALALLVFILPTEYSMGFFETLTYGLNLLNVVFRFVLFVLMLPLTICLQIFHFQNGQNSGADTPSAAQLPQPPPSAGPDSFWQFIQAALFWGILAGIVIFALSQYFKANASLWARITRLPVLKWFVQGLNGLWQWLTGAKNVITSVVSAGLRRLRPPSAAVRAIQHRMRNPGGLTTREQVIQLYLALLELAQEQGRGREESQTPYQYSRHLIANDPEVSPDVLDVTDAFVEARYTRHPIEPARVAPLRTQWERISTYFRKKQP